MPNLSPTLQRMFDVLKDGGPHTGAELYACLNDDLTDYRTVGVSLVRLRKAIRPGGLDILCVVRGGVNGSYRMVRYTSSDTPQVTHGVKP